MCDFDGVNKLAEASAEVDRARTRAERAAERAFDELVANAPELPEGWEWDGVDGDAVVGISQPLDDGEPESSRRTLFVEGFNFTVVARGVSIADVAAFAPFLEASARWCQALGPHELYPARDNFVAALRERDQLAKEEEA